MTIFHFKAQRSRRSPRVLRLSSSLPLILFSVLSLPLAAQSLASRNILLSPSADAKERLAAQVLSEEAGKRTHSPWPVSSAFSASQAPAIVVATREHLPQLLSGLQLRPIALPDAHPAEGYSIRVLHGAHPLIVVAGNDDRGALFGVGYLLRHMDLSPREARLHQLANTDQAPRIAIRGHQLGYRPKNNTYDAWTVHDFEQYIRQLALFGTNTIELIPPHSDDELSSPLFPAPPMETMVQLSALLDRYGLDCSIWYPAMERDYSDERAVERSVQEWNAVFVKLPRIDAIFIPGGDPGHTEPKVLFHLLERIAPGLHKYHPRAQIWVSPQAFSQAWLDEFYALVAVRPAWLTGVVYGPEMHPSPAEFRQRIPAAIPIRFYPDITHTASAEQPMENWDPAFLLTEGREPINPRPIDEQLIFRNAMNSASGFVTYSEGVNDDVNKFIWSALGWNSDQSPDTILQEYSRLFLDPSQAAPLTHAVFQLEKNWRGSALSNATIYGTLADMDAIAARSPSLRQNWRFQQLLYRANYDVYVQDRLRAETREQTDALALLRSSLPHPSEADLATAIRALGADPQCNLSGRCRQVQKLADDLFSSIHMQLTVSRHHALAIERGANADSTDQCITDRCWILEQLRQAQHSNAAQRELAVRTVLATTAPSAQFFDDLGQPGRQPHVVPQIELDKPVSSARLYSGVLKSAAGPAQPIAQRSYLGSLYDTPLRMHYAALANGCDYQLRVVYAKDAAQIALRANRAPLKMHCEGATPECLIATYAIASNQVTNGVLDLEWQAPAGLGGHGRVLQIATVELAPAGSCEAVAPPR